MKGDGVRLAGRFAENALRVGVFGLAPDTSNMGVSALCHSFLHMMVRAAPGCDYTIFDHGRGCREGSLRVGSERVPVTSCGAVGGVRLYRRGNLNTAGAFSKLGPLAPMNGLVGAIDRCAVVMDASAGDSFSDLYGDARFQAIVLPKKLAVRRSRPLLLLPQTYGPFKKPRNAQQARQAILASKEVWARDEHSLDVLRDLLGADFDAAIHRTGVDMAFGLPAMRPDETHTAGFDEWLELERKPVGFNISGLVWNSERNLDASWGFRANYRRLVRDAVSWLLKNTSYRILLVPHVLSPPGVAESDLQASRELLADLIPTEATPDRIRVVPNSLNEQELKWLIGQCSWFCGTRMHSTIAALSSGVPTASIVYSDKAAGVFDQCGQRDHIIDPRRSDNGEALSQFVTAFERRDTAKATLAEALVDVRAKLDAQSESIAAFALRHAGR